MIQILLSLILLVLVIGFFGHDLAEQFNQVGSGVVNVLISLPIASQIFIAIIIGLVWVTSAIYIIKNR